MLPEPFLRPSRRNRHKRPWSFCSRRPPLLSLASPSYSDIHRHGDDINVLFVQQLDFQYRQLSLIRELQDIAILQKILRNTPEKDNTEESIFLPFPSNNCHSSIMKRCSLPSDTRTVNCSPFLSARLTVHSQAGSSSATMMSPFCSLSAYGDKGTSF